MSNGNSDETGGDTVEERFEDGDYPEEKGEDLHQHEGVGPGQNRDLEEDPSIEELLEQDTQYTEGTWEEGLPAEEVADVSIGQRVEYYLVAQLGYDPDRATYDTFGEVSIREGEEVIDIFYEIKDDLSRPDKGLMMPLLERSDPDVLAKAIGGGLSNPPEYADIDDGSIRIGFRYSKEDWVRETEEVGDAILEFEQELGLDEYTR